MDLKVNSGFDNSPEKSSQNIYQSLGSFQTKASADALASILLGDYKSGGNRTPRRNSKYCDSELWFKKHPKSEDKKSHKKKEREEAKEEAKFVVTSKPKSD